MNFAPTPAVDVVGVYDQSFNQLFAASETMKASILRDKKVMEHPMESGGNFGDHAVFNPVEIELLMILTPAQYQNTYRQIEDAFYSNALLIVQTKVKSHANMTLQAMPHDEAPEIFDTIAISLKLKEVRLVKAQFQALPPASTNKKTDSSTVQRGEKSGSPDQGSGSGSETGSIAYGIFF